jgi:hypothetical protein
LYSISGEKVPSPQGRDIDGKYLDANEAELKAMFQKWRNEWTGSTRMSVINFLLYSNGRMWFHSSVDGIKKSQDVKFLLKVKT